MTDSDATFEMDKLDSEPYIVIETTRRKEGEDMLIHYQYKVYPQAIKDAVLEFMRNHRYTNAGKEVSHYHIELDRNENLMVAVIEQN